MESLAAKTFLVVFVLMVIAPLVAGSFVNKCRCDDWEDWDQ